MKELELPLQLLLGHQACHHHMFKFGLHFLDFIQLLLGFSSWHISYAEEDLLKTT